MKKLEAAKQEIELSESIVAQQNNPALLFHHPARQTMTALCLRLSPGLKLCALRMGNDITAGRSWSSPAPQRDATPDTGNPIHDESCILHLLGKN